MMIYVQWKCSLIALKEIAMLRMRSSWVRLVIKRNAFLIVILQTNISTISPERTYFI